MADREDQPDATATRPSGAPEIPEFLRDKAITPPAPKRKWSLMGNVKSPEMKAISVGIDFAAMVAGGLIVGWLLSEWLGSRTWFWVWVGLGFVCAGWKFYKDARALNAEVTREERRARGGN